MHKRTNKILHLEGRVLQCWGKAGARVRACVCVLRGQGQKAGAYLYQVTLQKRQESDMSVLVSSPACISLFHHFLFEL